jgi:GDPmannose 4,6-dehydratase
MTKRAFITGISGQDGAYLASILLSKGYSVFGATRNLKSTDLSSLKKLNILNVIQLTEVNLRDARSVDNLISSIRPQEIYHLAGQSSVSVSFNNPLETISGIIQEILIILDVIRIRDPSIRFLNAGSGDCFGGAAKADESTLFNPLSPYGLAKASSTSITKFYREIYGLFSCTGILFNHESPLRDSRFVSKKIISTACRIKNGQREKLVLGNIDIERDWGWAPDYVDAMWKILNQQKPDDYIIATGKTVSLRDFVAAAFEECDLNWKDHIKIDKSLFRHSEISASQANNHKACHLLNWRANFSGVDVARKLVQCELTNKYF